MSIFNGRFAILILIYGILAVSAFGQARAQSLAFTPDQKTAVERMIRDYLRKNPEIIIEAIEALQRKQRSQVEANARSVIAARAEDLFGDPDAPVGGNPDGDVSLVEFFDYRCGFCKRVHPTVRKLLKEDGNIRFVYKEFPILGPRSVYAARAALASRSQGKYREFHNALMEAKGNLTQKKVLRLAVSVGLDKESLVAEMANREAEFGQILERNHRLAADLNITGTPGFVAGDVVVRGAVDYETLRSVIVQVRSKQKQ